ncbi:hypothetical protein HDU86_005710 [Geranomyces michiganensis]|nr:hypothetical protein HDU86_005710 [Geranomyces michiganensis]
MAVEKDVKLDSDIMRRAGLMNLQFNNNVSASESFRAKMVESLADKNIQAVFSSDCTTVKLHGPTAAVVNDGAAFLEDKFSRRFRDYVLRRSATWSFKVETIWDAETCDMDLAAMVDNMAKVIPGIQTVYTRGETHVDVFLTDPASESSSSVPMATFGVQFKAIERNVEAKKRGVIAKQERDHADAVSAAEESRAVHLELAPFLPEVPVLTPPPGLISSTTADDGAQAPNANNHAAASTEKPLVCAPATEIIRNLSTGRNNVSSNDEPATEGTPIETATPALAEQISESPTVATTEVNVKFPIYQTECLTRRFMFLSDQVVSSLKESTPVFEALLAHLECIASAYGIEFVISTECGGIVLKGGPPRDLDEAQEDLEEFVNHGMRDLTE